MGYMSIELKKVRSSEKKFISFFEGTYSHDGYLIGRWPVNIIGVTHSIDMLRENIELVNQCVDTYEKYPMEEIDSDHSLDNS